MTKLEVELKKEEFKRKVMETRGTQGDAPSPAETLLRGIVEIDDLQRQLDNEAERIRS